MENSEYQISRIEMSLCLCMILPNNQLWVTSIDFNNAIEEDFDLFIYGNDTAYVSISTGFQYY